MTALAKPPFSFVSEAWLQRGAFTLNGGSKSGFKIECDALTDEEIETFAYLIAEAMPFDRVIGIPRGGLRLAKALEPLATARARLLIVDDVYTTGGSMERFRAGLPPDPSRAIAGVVLFARQPVTHAWVHPVFQMLVGAA